MDDLLAEFLTEAHEGLLALDAALVRLERAPEDAGPLSEVFRLVHTIKGTCGFLGLPRLEAVAHATENVLGCYRDGAQAVTRDGISRILRALDCIRGIIQALETTGAEPAGTDAALIATLDALAAGEAAPPGVPAGASPKLAGSAAMPPGAASPALSQRPASAATPPRGASPALRPAAASPAMPPGAAPQTIRVGVDLLEDLMVLVSELVLTRNQLLQAAQGTADGAYAAPLQRLTHITSELQEGVMRTRMQPIGHAWAKLPRLVRDLGIELGKRIELEMRGAETELDRQVLDLIRDPLTHMVRNAADHGLETPQARRLAGKPEAGTIRLNAYHQGGQIIIEIGDDGRGLNLERIRAKALAQGLATKTDLAAMPERDIQRFILRAGFTTAAEVTAVSGRGVGMDVVTTNLERIGGSIEVRSREGPGEGSGEGPGEDQGTTFVITIPLTLAIVSALIVQAGGERFAIPQTGVVELVRVGDATGPLVEWLRDAPVLRLRERLLPLVRLSALLRLEPEAPGGSPGARDPAFVVVAQVGPQVFGIIVDRVFDIEEIVVKPVAPILRHVTMFCGNTILGDGSVIMILDPSGIARASGIAAEPAPHPVAGPATAKPDAAPTALLLFRAVDQTPKAVPLGLIARLEELPRAAIETAGGRPVVQYRGRPMPLVPLAGGWDPATAPERQPVLVLAKGDRTMGLLVDAILDVVEVPLAIEAAGERPGYLGSTVVGGRVTELIDTAWWLRQGDAGGFGAGARRVLVVADSAVFRGLVVPALAAAGYAVTAVAGARAALRLRDAGQGFDALVSDIDGPGDLPGDTPGDRPGMDGLALAGAVRAGGAWRDLPLVALSGRAAAADIEQARGAGFTELVAKSDRTALVSSLRQCLAATMACRPA